MTTPADHPDYSAPSRVGRRVDDAADDHGAELSEAVRGRDEGFDLASLGEITDRDGYAVYDPAAPGAVRSLTADEQHALTDSIRSSQLGVEPDDVDTGLHSESPYRPNAEWGDPDYREPASDAEATARTAYVREHFPATGWTARANTALEDALDDAAERAVLSDRAHDPDPPAWAEYRRLLALDQLAPLPTERDALDDPMHDAHQNEPQPAQDQWTHDSSPPDGSRQDWDHEDRVLRDHLADEAAQSGGSRHDGPFTDTQGRRWASTGAWAAGTCDPAKATDTTHPDDPERLRRRLEDLRAELATRDDAPPDMQEELRREQLARWHDDDHRAPIRGDIDARGETPDDGEGGGGMGEVTRRPPQQPGGGDGEFARVEALAGLAREVDGLRRGLEALVGTPTRVDDLARTVAQLADAVAATPARPGPTLAPSWLTAPTDSEALVAMLGELAQWLHAVFLRYPDGAAVLPECWLWHPDVVEELLWLMHAWRAAYEGRGASVQLAGDWHDRQRPGVIRRVKMAAGSCSQERHQSRPGWHDQPGGATEVPSLDATAEIAAWWAEARDDAGPEPARRPDRGSDWLTGPGLGTNGANGAHR